MAEEIEAKILEVDVPALEKKLADIGAQRIGDFLYQIKNWDFPGYVLKKQRSWVRLRTDGEKTTLAFKQHLGTGADPTQDDGMDEYEVEVSRFDEMETILRKMGMFEKHSQEKRRTTWRKGNITYDIDTWPQIPTYLGVEGTAWDAVDRAVAELGFNPQQKRICSASGVYAFYGFEFEKYTRLTFNEIILRPVEK